MDFSHFVLDNPGGVCYNDYSKRKEITQMTILFAILVAILVTLAVLAFLFFIALVTCNIIVNYNIHKYGYWWGKLPKWAETIVDSLAI